jgi:hypothetical protein
MTGSLTSLLPNVIDGKLSTYFKNTLDNCYIEFDIAATSSFKLKIVKFQPRFGVNSAIFSGSMFEYSTDGTTWINLVTFQNEVHSDWNYYMPTEPISGMLKVRFRDPLGSTDS